MHHLYRQRIDYLIARLKAGRSHKPTLIAEIVKAYNTSASSTPMRRATDLRIQGHNVVQS